MRGEQRAEEGSMLVGLVVAIFLILLALSVAAPTVAKELRREQEVEAVHRGNQYVRAIQLYYRKNGGQYPGSIEQLEKTNNIRFLRQRYTDPMTGKVDWRLIHVGEAKTTVKGFFGQPLAGMAPGLGSAAGMASSGGIGAGAAGTAGAAGSAGSGSAFGSSSSGSSFGSSGSSFGSSSSSGSAFGSSSSGSSFGSSSSSGFGSGTSDSSGTSGTSGTGSPGGGTSTLGSAAGIASQSSGGLPVGGGPFVGVGLSKQGDSIVVLNEQATYQTWEFLYDPRVDQMKAKASLLGGPASAGGLGSASGNGSGIGTGAGGAPGSTGSPFGGSSPGGSSSGFGSSPTTPGNGTSGLGTTPPQQ
jgi:type II secretory pathway pseudopilin PulG